MKDFKIYIRNIFESRDKSYDVEWNQINTNSIGYFSSDTDRYRILILKNKYNSFLIKFQILINNNWQFNKPNDTNIKEAMQIFSTLEKEYNNFILKNKPNSIIFFSIEPGNRNNIYLRFCNNVAEKFNYKYEIIEYNNYNCYFIFNKEYSEDQIKELFNNISIEDYNFDNFD
jgi:hypothetical protein